MHATSILFYAERAEYYADNAKKSYGRRFGVCGSWFEVCCLRFEV
jgi:hypothetical protein